MEASTSEALSTPYWTRVHRDARAVADWWKVFLENVTLPFGIQSEILWDNEMGLVRVLLRWAVPDRDDPSRMTEVVTRFVPEEIYHGGALVETEQFERATRRLFYEVQSLVRHETAEGFLVAGERVFDPHSKKVPRG